MPTPTASAAKGSSPATLTRKNGKDRTNDRLDHFIGDTADARLNPDWVELLMGWPLNWTRLSEQSNLSAPATYWWDNWEKDTPKITAEKTQRDKRIICLGNGQVPICAATAWQLLSEV